MKNMESDFALGATMYPKTIEEALQVLQAHQAQPLYKAIMKKAKMHKKPIQEGDGVELSFAQKNRALKKKKNLCFKCGKPGHRAFQCMQGMDNPETEREQTHVQYSWMD